MEQITNKQLKNYDHVESKDYETYMKKGIINFWATVNTIYEQSDLIQLCKKYGYSKFSTQWLNVDEVVKDGATMQDLANQIRELERGQLTNEQI